MVIPVLESLRPCPYYYSTYSQYDEVQVPGRGNSNDSGPIRIGQGIEFDYASVHAIKEERWA